MERQMFQQLGGSRLCFECQARAAMKFVTLAANEEFVDGAAEEIMAEADATGVDRNEILTLALAVIAAGAAATVLRRAWRQVRWLKTRLP